MESKFAPGVAEPTAATVRPRPWQRYVFPVIVLAIASVQAGYLYAHFLHAPRQLWVDVLHDRNAHYWMGLNFALDLRHADLANLVHDLHSAHSWPPLHALLVGAVLAIGGNDYRLAVLPSLAAWVGAILFAFLTARRTVRRGGNAAGIVAAAFLLVSPAHRAFATDIMLESLGACLSLAVLYCYLVTVQARTARAGCCLGLVLTALFFEKYNYWLLVVLGLGAAETLSRWRADQLSLRAMTGANIRSWVRTQLRHPLTYPLLAIAIALAVLALTGGGTIRIADHAVKIRSPRNLLTVAYLIFLLRLLPWWYAVGRFKIRLLEAPLRAVFYWHGVPVLLWWLWPQRLGDCLWYVSPVNSGETPHHDLLGGVPYYAGCLAHDYHLGPWSLLVSAILAGVGLLAWRRLRPGSTAILCFVLIAAALTCVHPNRKSRFLHSWIAVGWVMAGAGLVELLARRQALTAVAAGALVLSQGPGVRQVGHAQEGGPQANRPSMLDVTDAYLESLAGSRRLAIVSNMPIKFWTGWTFLARYGRPALLATDLPGLGGAGRDDPQALSEWLQRSGCDHVVFVHVDRASPLFQSVPYTDYSSVPDLMAHQEVLRARDAWHQGRLGCSVLAWSHGAEPPVKDGTSTPHLLSSSRTTSATRAGSPFWTR